MDSTSKKLKMWFSKEIHSATNKHYPVAKVTLEQIINSISKPKKEYGDMSCSVALRISKVTGKSPADVANTIIKEIGKSKLVFAVAQAGGYINLSINGQEYTKEVFGEIEKAKDRYGSSDIGNGAKAIVEYPAVNPNKPWHIGHLRNALLGDSISNIMDFSGYKVEREDYIDDLGLQMAESLWGYINIGNKPDKKFDEWLGEQYVEVNKIIKEKKIEDQVATLLKSMEHGEGDKAKLAREVSEKCVDAQYKTAYAYGIYHDVMVWESDIVKANLLHTALDMAIKKGALEKRNDGKNAGCIVMDLSKVRDFAKDFENPEETEKVIVRSDGTATYVAKDLAFHMWKLGIIKSEFKYKPIADQNEHELYSTVQKGESKEFGNANIAVNIIGSAQRYPQLILRAIFSLMGYAKESQRIIHVAYGEVGVEGGTLSGRKGGWMGGEGASFTADELLKEGIAKALETTQKSSRISEKKKVKEIASSIGRSAIRFEFLRISPGKPVVFSWTTALNFEGNSGPYCMYTYARANRILEKADYKSVKISSIDFSAIKREQDFELIKLLSAAQESVEKAAQEYNPSIITDYIIELTSAFSRFYESMPVMNSAGAQESRMRLLDAYMQVTKNMFRLVGIDAVSHM